MKKIILLPIIFSFIFFSCEKEISLDLPDGAIIDVIEAVVYDSIFFARITKSSNNYFNGEETEITDAIIELDVDGKIFTLNYNNYKKNTYIIDKETDAILASGNLGSELKNIYYLNDKSLMNAKNYKLKVTIGNNIYTCEEIGFQKPKLDTVTMHRSDIVGRKRITLDIKLEEFPDNFEAKETFFRLIVDNQEDLVKYSNDRSNFSNSDIINIEEISQDLHLIKFYYSFITEKVYRYREILNNLTGVGPPNTVSSPENPPTNFKIEKGNAKRILGYFAVYNLLELNMSIDPKGNEISIKKFN